MGGARYLLLVGFGVASLAFPSIAAADSGSVEIRYLGDRQFEGAFTTAVTQCPPADCGWWPVAMEQHPATPCSPHSNELVYVGEWADGPGWKRDVDRFYSDRLTTRICLFVRKSNGDVLLAEKLYTVPFVLRVRGRRRQPLRRGSGNLAMRLRCSHDCVVRLRATPYYAGRRGRRRVLRRLGWRERFRLRRGENPAYGFRFTRPERRRLRRVMSRYGSVLWLFRFRAISRHNGAVSRARQTIRMVRPRRSSRCMPGYSPCLPRRDDLDCGDIPASKKPVRVRGDDPYQLDRDGDGYGCDRG